MKKVSTRILSLAEMKTIVPILGLTLTMGLTACNGSDQAQVIEPDWINTPSQGNPVTNPSPAPTSAPAPTPTATPTPPPSDPTALYTGPASVAKYVQKFVDDGKAQGVDVLPDMTGPKLEIRIASLDAYGSSTIGLCETGGGKRRVTFDPDFWDNVSETQRELLAHHELGHCVLYRGHKSTTLSTGAYGSIMYPIIMSSSTYTNNYQYYLEELFTQSASMLVDPDQVQIHVCNPEDLAHAE